MSVEVSLQTTVTTRKSDTSQLPAADAAFVVALQNVLASAPGDALCYITATNGAAVTVRAVQSDRSVFITPDGSEPAVLPALVAPAASDPQALMIDPSSIEALAAALTPATALTIALDSIDALAAAWAAPMTSLASALAAQANTIAVDAAAAASEMVAATLQTPIVSTAPAGGLTL